MKRYTTIIFDCDGTILNTLDDLKDSMNVLYQKFAVLSVTVSVN